MKKNWEIKTLGEVCDIQNGYAFKSSDYTKDGVRIIRISNVQKGVITDKSPKFLPLNFCKRYKVFEINERDILVSLTGDVGRVGFFPKSLLPAFLNQRVGRFCDLNEALVLKDFLFTFLNSSQFEELVIVNAEGAAQKNTSTKKIKEIKIPVPPLSEQKRLVKILNEKFTEIEELKKIIEHQIVDAKELFESRLNEVFSKNAEWKESLLEDHIKFIDYRGRTPKKTKNGVRLITAKNIKKGYLQIEPEEFIAKDDYDSWMTRGIPIKGDILFTTEAPLANVAKLNTDEKVAFAQRTIIFHMNREVFNPDFLFYLMLSKVFQDEVLRRGTGSTVLGIKASLLRKISISFPTSLVMQKKIAIELAELSEITKNLEVILRRKIADLEELKKSYLQEAFAGKL